MKLDISFAFLSSIIIDTSKIKYFKESTSNPILSIVIDIINKKLTILN